MGNCCVVESPVVSLAEEARECVLLLQRASPFFKTWLDIMGHRKEWLHPQHPRFGQSMAELIDLLLIDITIPAYRRRPRRQKQASHVTALHAIFTLLVLSFERFDLSTFNKFSDRLDALVCQERKYCSRRERLECRDTILHYREYHRYLQPPSVNLYSTKGFPDYTLEQWLYEERDAHTNSVATLATRMAFQLIRGREFHLLHWLVLRFATTSELSPILWSNGQPMSRQLYNYIYYHGPFDPIGLVPIEGLPYLYSPDTIEPTRHYPPHELFDTPTRHIPTQEIYDTLERYEILFEAQVLSALSRFVLPILDVCRVIVTFLVSLPPRTT